MYEQRVKDFISLNNLQTLGGTDTFDSKEFNGREWSAPFIQQPSVLKEFIKIIGLIDAEIKEIAIVEDSIGHLGNIHVSSLYPNMCVKRIKPSGEYEYEPWDYDEVIAWLNNKGYIDYDISWIDTPVILLTDKGKFEIDFSESSSVRMSKDCIPEKYYQSDDSIKYSYDSRKLLACLKGDIIEDVSVEECSYSAADNDFTGSWGIYLEENLQSYISKFALHLQSGRKMVFYNDYDWGGIYLLDKKGERMKIATNDLNNYLKTPIGTAYE
ncbi:hypothetical protein [Selenomonas ruminantium]|uniref:hypothetical protein n=1 Tax=Selenomonas ruminantium TaxID=971 RepID=UPI000945A22F|nr:hypothetical protein [Selenomonas ruminantium]